MKTIANFLQHSAGEWLSQRTQHHLVFSRFESVKVNLSLEWLEPAAADAIATAKGLNLSPSVGGATVRWSGDQQGEQTLIAIEASPEQGQLWNPADPKPINYSLVEGVLMLVQIIDTGRSEERIWFASDNLRLRTSLIERFGSYAQADFCSEIRRLKAAPASISSSQQ